MHTCRLQIPRGYTTRKTKKLRCGLNSSVQGNYVDLFTSIWHVLADGEACALMHVPVNVCTMKY